MNDINRLPQLIQSYTEDQGPHNSIADFTSISPPPSASTFKALKSRVTKAIQSPKVTEALGKNLVRIAAISTLALIGGIGFSVAGFNHLNIRSIQLPITTSLLSSSAYYTGLIAYTGFQKIQEAKLAKREIATQKGLRNDDLKKAQIQAEKRQAYVKKAILLLGAGTLILLGLSLLSHFKKSFSLNTLGLQSSVSLLPIFTLLMYGASLIDLGLTPPDKKLKEKQSALEGGFEAITKEGGKSQNAIVQELKKPGLLAHTTKGALAASSAVTLAALAGLIYSFTGSHTLKLFGNTLPITTRSMGLMAIYGGGAVVVTQQMLSRLATKNEADTDKKRTNLSEKPSINLMQKGIGASVAIAGMAMLAYLTFSWIRSGHRLLFSEITGPKLLTTVIVAADGIATLYAGISIWQHGKASSKRS